MGRFLPSFHVSGHCLTDQTGEAEGRDLTVTWMGFVLMIALLRRRAA